MTDRFNTIAGWILFAGIVLLGTSVVTGEMFHGGRPATMGYPIEGVELEGQAAEEGPPLAVLLAQGDLAAGEQAFRKCAACHNVEPGGANQLGPGLYGVMGAQIAAHPGYNFSDALRGHGGTWGWEEMDAWLANPRRFAPGTKMTFAGIANPQERANLMLFMNSRDNAPLPLPPVPVEAPAPAGDEAEAETTGGAGGEGPAANQAAPTGEESAAQGQ
ncbi:MAG TPA: cytochrome c family protein [Sphingomicrobium sp.]|nr:cytochrome c family protein [Sphingomicrobium sp.]